MAHFNQKRRTKMSKLKLSQLPDSTEISAEDSNSVYTVKELKREILEFGEPHHETGSWYTLQHKRWHPSAASMIESYIESEYCDMYEDWDERANDCITQDVVNKVQSILNEAFKGDSATEYWSYIDPVEIDIFPESK
jgi:hypothetical protein